MFGGGRGTGGVWGGGAVLLLFFFFTLVTGPRRSLSLKMSDTRLYEPQIRARLGTRGGVGAVPPPLASGLLLESAPLFVCVAPALGVGVSGFGFRVSGFISLGFTVWHEFRVHGSRLRVYGLGFGVQGLGLGVWGQGCRV